MKLGVRFGVALPAALLVASLVSCTRKASTPPDSGVAPRIQVQVTSSARGGFELQVHTGNVIGRFFPTLEQAGFYPNGPAWLGVLEYLASQRPAVDVSDFDDQSDAATVFSDDRRDLEVLKRRLEAATTTDAVLVRTFEAARKAGHAPGDLHRSAPTSTTP